MLFSLIEKGKQCHNQTAKGYQQANNPYKYQNDICNCHEHHLLPMYSGEPVFTGSGGCHPVMGTFL
jgi:hypothetical protein